MGILRFLLALSVFFAHCAPQQVISFIDARYAVQLFFMISGFLISYVLISNKNYRTNFYNFYINRFLKIYPIYYLILLFTLFIFLISNTTGFPFKAYFVDAFSNASLGWKTFIIIVNTALLGIDYCTLIAAPSINLINGMVIPPAWSLGLEVLFYLIAPFILYRSKRILILFITSAAIKYYLMSKATSFYGSWVVSYFPTELAFFLFGALSHQTLYPLFLKYSAYKMSLLGMYTITIGCAASICLIGFISKLHNYYVLIYFASFFLVLPAAFIFSSKFKWDRFIGELSFPIYLIHILLFNEIDYIIRSYIPSWYSPTLLPYITLIATLISSILIVVFITFKLEKFRQKRKVSNQPIRLINSIPESNHPFAHEIQSN